MCALVDMGILEWAYNDTEEARIPSVSAGRLADVGPGAEPSVVGGRDASSPPAPNIAVGATKMSWSSKPQLYIVTRCMCGHTRLLVTHSRPVALRTLCSEKVSAGHIRRRGGIQRFVIGRTFGPERVGGIITSRSASPIL